MMYPRGSSRTFLEGGTGEGLEGPVLPSEEETSWSHRGMVENRCQKGSLPSNRRPSVFNEAHLVM